MSEVHVFTSAAFNYIPKVRMLFKSIREFHPEWTIHLALADEKRPDIDLSNEPFDDIVSISDLNIPDWNGWAYCHSIVELATAIKPFMLTRLLQLPGCKKVIYLDPDTVVFSRLDDILNALDSANIVLTPHQTTPEKNLSAVMDNEICSLKHGVYNLGFFAVSATDVGLTFAKWWAERVYHFCRADIPNGLFTDQRWIDLVPAFFNGVAIMRSSRHNVATWNLTTRDFTVNSDGKYFVDGEPLGFYHFTGFDSGAHRIMASKNAGENSDVHKLIDWYENETKNLAQDPLAKVIWAYGQHSDGSAISKAQRIVYRERVDLQNAFPSPFEENTYNQWWRTQGINEYPELFNVEQEGEALKKFSLTLTPGFRGGCNDFDNQRFWGLIKNSISSPKTGLALGKKGWEILKNEGVKGIKRRFIK
ncbi:glycosyltransferase [Aeromonas veronii]